MNIQILVSKKGTQVVTATNLHDVLDLPLHKYNSNIKQWLSDFYAFKDDIRQPIVLHDFAIRSQASKREDYYISLELAKLITLNSNSPVKQQLANELFKAPQLAKAMAMSQTQLYRKIKALTNQSTAQYIKNVRLNAAKYLLETTDYPIGQVAVEVGFKTQAHFSRAFQELFGLLPSKTRS